VLGAILALIPVLILEYDATSDTWRTVAMVGNWLIWLIFAAEFGSIMIVAGRKRAALRAHWLDAAIVALTVPPLSQALAWLRFARAIRLVRLGVLVARMLQAERRMTSGDTLRIAAILTLTAVLVGGAAEQTVDQGDFATLWDGIWWAVVTVTTVGYGDVYPKSVGGRIIGIILMLVGISFLSLLTAAIASRFVKQERGTEYEEMMATLRAIQADLADLRARINQ
jgi:voltage-gated potassium channel